MRQLACLSVTVVLVILIYIHRILNNMIPNYQNINRTKPLPAIHHANLHGKNPKCRNKLHTLLQGKWKTKSEITFKDYLDSRRIEMQMRIRKGWPPLLYHGDLRCGTKYPLPRVMHKNNTEGYYLDVPSQCDLLSDSPCCRDDIGWCGNGNTFCNCDTCIDYREYFPAELANWETTSGCKIRDIDGKEACRFLGKHFTSVTFIGDSLVRHIFSSLLLLLTQDKESGALLTDIKQIDKEICSGENQFTDSACHKKLIMYWKDIKSNPRYCSSTHRDGKPILSFVEAYNVNHLSLASEELEQRLSEKNPLVIIGIGVHDNFNHTKVINDYLSPLVGIRDSKANKGIFIWMNTHSSGPLKPNQFRDVQGNKNIQIFNKVLQDYCEKRNILLMDTFNFTKGIHSFDGTHYGYEINRLKTQILLDSLEEITGA